MNTDVTFRMAVSRLPPGLLRRIGRLQFHSSALRSVIVRLNRRLTAGEGTIRYGIGAGLRFDPSTGYPGYILGTTEPHEQAIVARYVKPGDVFYDIGANIGFFSTLAGRLVGPMGSVWAFEPHPGSADRARRNAKLNSFDHVTVEQAAVGREGGEARLELGDSSAAHRLTPRGDGPRVRVVSLDAWVAKRRAPLPTFIKMDVEGSEIDALNGMIGVIKSALPVILVEIHWRGAACEAFFREHLEPLGYMMTALEGPVPTEESRWHALLAPPTAPSVESSGEAGTKLRSG
jgi:FkbM family methyltransferase